MSQSHRLRFAHPLTAESAHSALLATNRRLLHGAAADAIRASIVPGEAGEANLGLELLRHLEAAERWEEAHDHCCELLVLLVDSGHPVLWDDLLERAQQAWRMTQPESAAAGRLSAGLLYAFAAPKLLNGEVAEAHQLAQQALGRAQEGGQDVFAARALMLVSACLIAVGNTAEGRDMLDEALRLAIHAGDRQLALVIRTQIISRMLQHEDLESFWEATEAVLHEIREVGNLRLQVHLLSQCSIARRMEGAGLKSYHLRMEALELARQIGDRKLEGWLLGNIGNQLLALGRIEEAINYCEQSIDLLLEVGDRMTVAQNRGNLGVAYGKLGLLEDEQRQYEASLAEHRALNDVRCIGVMSGNLADVHMRRGDYGAALDYAREAVRCFDQLEDDYWLGWVLNLSGRICHVSGDYAGAESAMQASAECLRRFGITVERMDMLVNWIKLRIDPANPSPAAEPSVSELVDEAQELDRTHDEADYADARQELDKLVSSLNQPS